MAKVYGVDVSEHNGKVNWAALKNAGIKFVLIRSGYGVSHTDAQFYNNISGARAAGMRIGIYHFSYALNADGAKREAAYVLKLIEPYKEYITLPVYFDFEYDTVKYAKEHGVTLGKEAFNNHCVAFCEAIKAAGYKPGVYYNKDYYNHMVALGSVGGYSQWFAQYASKPSISGYDIWQKSSSWTCNGASGRFDYNEAEDTFIYGASAKVYTLGWHKDSKGWWYADTTSSYVRNACRQIDGKWYFFDTDGYMEADMWKLSNNELYYLGADGAMATNKDLIIGGDGKVVPKDRVSTLDDAPDWAKSTLSKLINKGILKGTNATGSGELNIDIGWETMRTLVLLDRAGAFD